MMGEHEELLPTSLQHVSDVFPETETKLTQIQGNHNELTKKKNEKNWIGFAFFNLTLQI